MSSFSAHSPAPGSSRRLPPDTSSSMDYVVPDNDPFLREWRPSRKTDESIREQRQEFTDYFHAPGCYGDTTNLNNPPQDMSPVNKKVFEVFRQLYEQALVITSNRHGQIQSRHQDWTFFRFTLKPLDPTDNASAQDWFFQPLEKYKSKPMVSTRVRMELMTSPKARHENSVVFVRTHDSRVTPVEFLDSQRFVQSFRTRGVAKALTGIEAVGNVHAELLIDAAIERNITSARLKKITPLSGFWKLPAEVRGRVFQLAAEAEGNIYPVNIKAYHRSRPSLLLNKLARLIREHDYLPHGDNLVFSNGFILPRSTALIVASYEEDENFSTLWDIDSSEADPDLSDGQETSKIFATPALLRTSRAVREEAIRILFVQPTFCFSDISQLHNFVTMSLDDTISALRKMRITMGLLDILIIFSLARRGLTFDELEALDKVFEEGYAIERRQRVGRQLFSQKRQNVWEKRFDANDAVFIQRADKMRFTQLTIEVSDKSESTLFADSAIRVDRTAGGKWTRLGRLLLVKLVNLTLDSWAQKDGSKPHLQIIWPQSVEQDERDALVVMGTVYLSTEVTSQS